MAIYRVKRYSRIQDEDYYEDSRRAKEEATSGKHAATLSGGLLGAGAGVALGGSTKGRVIGGAIGAVAGGGLGHYFGRKYEKGIHDEEDKKVRRYKASSEKDKEYLRHRAEKQREERLRERQIQATREAGWTAAAYR